MNIQFHIDSVQATMKNGESAVTIIGWYVPEPGKSAGFHLWINGQEQEIHPRSVARPDVRQELKTPDVPEDCGFQITGQVPAGETISDIRLTVLRNGVEETILESRGRQLEEFLAGSLLRHSIDNVEHWVDEEGTSRYRVTGWVIYKGEPGQLKIEVCSREGAAVEGSWKPVTRADLSAAGLVGDEETATGFVMEYASDRADDQICFLMAGGVRRRVSLDNIIRRNKKAYRKQVIRQLAKSFNGKNLMRMSRYVMKHGLKGIREKTLAAMAEESPEEHYQRWYERHKASPEQLAEQKKAVFAVTPKISILVPTYHTPVDLLRETLDSVTAQSYENWELCVADGSQGDAELESVLEEYHGKDPRIIYKILEKNEGISGNTNQALAMATGDFIGLLDHDDLLTPDALYEVICRLQDPEVDIVYTDEDKIYGKERHHIDPNFKPDFSMDLFRSHNYITHFFVVRRSIAEQVGGFRSEYDGSQDYDLMFRCIEQARRIEHVPRILYHWRMISGSTAEDPASKMYCYEAGRKAIASHLERMGIKGKVEHVGLWGMYHVIYDTAPDPLISIVIPNKDHTDDLDLCVKSILKKSAYRNFEIIIVENNSEKQETFDYYKKLEQEDPCVKVVYWEGSFNYSAINNFGVKHARGDYILLLNNDTELISENALSDMLGICMRSEVGIVGAKLLFADNTVQHAGIVLGFGGFAGHVFSGIGRDDYGYMVRARINCNYSAVTAACLMTKRSVFEEVGCLTEEFVVALNDVDYCLKVREKGYLVVYDAFAEWYHYESKSRGYEDTPEKQERFMGEVKRFRHRWQEVLDKGDPYYNRNFPVTLAPFTLD